MILYKYTNLNTAQKIITNSTVRFTPPPELNDPFEISSLFYESENRNYAASENHMRNIVISLSYGILSLSRTPLNPLMWAHYAPGKKRPYKEAILLTQNNNTHGGMVFGIDTNLAGLDNEGQNVIPARFGSVIYTTTKPTNQFTHSEHPWLYDGTQFHFDPSLMEAIQRTFLYKSSHWSYEEEVRVVRNIHRREQIQEIDKNSIKEIYIGSGHRHSKDYLMRLNRKIKKSFPFCSVFICNIQDKEWSISAQHLDDYLKQNS